MLSSQTRSTVFPLPMQQMGGSLKAHHFTILLLHIWLIFLILGFAFNFLNLLWSSVH